jgi:putative sigma-54 modulation protein
MMQFITMNIVINTHNLTLSDGIREHVINKIQKIEHLDHRAIDVRVILELDNSKAPKKQFTCSIRLGVRGRDLFASDTEGDLYTAIDLAVKKLEQQIRKRHTKFENKVFRAPSKSKRAMQEKGIETT